MVSSSNGGGGGGVPAKVDMALAYSVSPSGDGQQSMNLSARMFLSATSRPFPVVIIRNGKKT